VNLSEVLDQLPTDGAGRRVFGEPHETADGSTVIPVARIRMGRGRRGSGPDSAPFGYAAVPAGVFVVHDGKASWVPAIDENRVALIGVTTGLLAAVIGTLAILRQPPWPKITIKG